MSEFQVSASLIRKLRPADLRAHAHADAPGARLLNRCLCSIKCVPEFRVCLMGPTKGPLYGLVKPQKVDQSSVPNIDITDRYH